MADSTTMTIAVTKTSLLEGKKILSDAVTTSCLWYERGKLLIRRGDYSAALLSFDISLKRQPNFFQAWVFRGVVMAHLRQYEAALTSFNRALALQPEHREAWIFRGAILTYLDRPAEALSSYSTALKLQRQSADICADYPLWVP